MADFLDTFKRHESSEGSIEEDEEEFNNQFVQGNLTATFPLLIKYRGTSTSFR